MIFLNNLPNIFRLKLLKSTYLKYNVLLYHLYEFFIHMSFIIFNYQYYISETIDRACYRNNDFTFSLTISIIKKTAL